MNLLKRNCTLIGASSQIGQEKDGVEAAPQWLRYNKVFDHLNTEFKSVLDRGDFAPEEIMHLLQTEEELHILSHYSQNLAQKITNELKEDNFVLTIGGDHSIAVGTLGGTHNFDEDVKLIWVDAHADINTFKTSPTGNTHGMPLAWHMHLMSEENQKPFPWIKKFKKENLVYLGLRDIDPGEQAYLNNLGIKYYTADDVGIIGIENVLKEIDDYFKPNPGKNVHISFDVDGIDPHFFPATGTPVSGGLSLDDGKKIINHFCVHYKLLALDLVEINPALGDAGDIQMTLNSTRELIGSLSEKSNIINDKNIDKIIDKNTDLEVDSSTLN